MTSQISSLTRNDGKEGYQQKELIYHQAESVCWYFSSYSSEVIWLWSLNTSVFRPWQSAMNQESFRKLIFQHLKQSSTDLVS